MRTDLKAIDGTRTRFRATFQRFGKKSGYKVRWILTVLLIDVQRVGKDVVITDHAWMTAGKRFKDLDLHSGDIVEFDARVGLYRKGYSEDDYDNPFRYDYRFERPTKIKKVGRATGDFDEDEILSQEIKDDVESDELGLPPEKIRALTVMQVPEPEPPVSLVPEIKESTRGQKTLLEFLK